MSYYAIREYPLFGSVEIPKFTMNVKLSGVGYNLLFRYNRIMLAWYMNLYSEDGTILQAGSRLSSVTALTSRSFASGMPRGTLFITHKNRLLVDPTLENLARDYVLMLAEDAG